MLNINQYLCKKKKNDKEHKLPLQHHYSAQEYPPSSGTLSVLNSHLGWNSNHYHWWQQQLRICRFFSFSGKRQKNTEILFTKEGKGAGYARNIGLSHARGKWIIFADADDFFTADCFTILNEYMDSPHEVIYFNVRFVMSDNPSQESRRGTYYTNFFNDVNPENKLRYQSQVPWGKMIRRSFLSTFHIQFDETRIANDVYFSCLVGIYAPKATTDRRIIYYCTESGQSLAMSKQDRESLIIRFNASMKCNRLLRQEKSTITCHHFRGVSLRQKQKNGSPPNTFLNTCFSSACKHSKNYIMLFPLSCHIWMSRLQKKPTTNVTRRLPT